MKEFDLLIETLKKFEGVEVMDTNIDPLWIHFKCNSKNNINLIADQIAETKTHHQCSFLALGNTDDQSSVSYQIFIENNQIQTAILVLTKKLETILTTKDHKKARQKELGLPDLSLVTIRQMAAELKSRQNLTFALVWIENNKRDNIAIEGSGNPTQLIGLLARGSHLAIEWADKDIKFYNPNDEN